MSNILIIDDDIASCRTLQLHFHGQGHTVELAHSVDDGLIVSQRFNPDLIILDIRMPGRDGLEGLPEFKRDFPDAPVIMITAFHDMDSTIKAMQRGADDYIHKPVDIDELDSAVATALIRKEPDDEGISLEKVDILKLDSNTMAGSSRAMKEVFKTIGLVAPKPVTVLITGESGTGKELVARAIHHASAHASGPFVAVNCAAMVETLLESDLFGHEKGAFTGAVSKQPGKFLLANNGTIFLDEIGELSPAVQAKLLRVLQEREYIPVGGNQVQTTNARIIAATNVNLVERATEGMFREDLFYRLQVVTIHMPTLRERKEDLPDLIQTLLTRINREMRQKVTRIAMDVMEAFYAYDWPGNIRELENLLMKAVALCHGDMITLDLLPEKIKEAIGSENNEEIPSAEQSLQDIEKTHVARVLKATNWHRGNACEILGVSRPRLRRLIQQYGLNPPDGTTSDDVGAYSGGKDGKFGNN